MKLYQRFLKIQIQTRAVCHEQRHIHSAQLKFISIDLIESIKSNQIAKIHISESQRLVSKKKKNRFRN